MVTHDLPVIAGSVALSFLELMELRVVKSFIDEGVSLQTVRVAARVAAQLFGTKHPFAAKRLFTDGRRIFSTLSEDREGEIVELSERQHLQLILREIIAPFMKEIDFSGATGLAERWWPRGRAEPIVLDPTIALGAPVIVHTRIKTESIARMATVMPPEAVAEAFEIGVRDVQSAVAFEHDLIAA